MPELTTPTEPSVVDETGKVTTFEPSHLVGSLVKANIEPTTAIHAANVVHGVLTGALQSSGAATVTTDQLRAVTGAIATAPKSVDPGTIARILTKPAIMAASGTAANARIQMSIAQLFASIIAGAGSDTPAGQIAMTGIGYLEATLTDGSIVEQYLAFGNNPAGAAMEFADGATRAIKPMGPANAWAALAMSGAELQPLGLVLSKLDGLHPAWSTAGPHMRSISLINVGSDLGIFPPFYVATAVIPTAAMVAIFNASTGALIVQMPLMLSGVLAPQLILASAWKTAWDVLCKVLSLVGMVAGIAALAGGGAISAPSGVGPAAAALGITALVVAIGLKLTDIMVELFGPDKAGDIQKKMKAFHDKFDALNKGVKDGTISSADAKTQIQNLNNDFQGLQNDMNEFINQNGDPTGAMSEGVQAFGDGMKALAEAVK